MRSSQARHRARTAPMSTATLDRHGIAWQAYVCTGCGRTETQRADVEAVTCHRITEHPRPTVRQMRPTEEAQR